MEKLKWRYSITGNDTLAWRWYLEDEEGRAEPESPDKVANNYSEWDAKALLRQHKDTLDEIKPPDYTDRNPANRTVATMGSLRSRYATNAITGGTSPQIQSRQASKANVMGSEGEAEDIPHGQFDPRPASSTHDKKSVGFAG